MTVKEIVAQYIREHGYDGLCNEWCPDGSGCSLDDLLRCGAMEPECKPGYKRMVTEDEWVMQEEKPGDEGSEG